MAEPVVLFDEGAYERLLQGMKRERFEPTEWLRLRVEAERLALSPGFEQLISLEGNRIEEYPHQIEAALTALRRMRGRAILADEVGLGKTIEAGIVMKELLMRGLARKALILAPASLTLQWQEEMASKFDEEFAIGSSSGDWSGDRLIASIDLAKRPENAEKIHAQSFDLLVVDEAHRLRNRRSQAWGFVNRIRRKYMLLLTATPVHNDLSELYSLVTLLNPGLLKTYRAFRQRYVNPQNPLKPANWAELKGLLSEAMIRNRRASVSVKFPPRTAYTYRVKLSPAEWSLYTAVTRFIREEKPSATDLLTLSLLQREVCSSPAAALGTLDKLAQGRASGERLERLQELSGLARVAASAAKVEAVCKIVEKAQDKVIVFTEFSASQRLIAGALRAGGVRAVLYHGGLTPAEKNEAVRAFREERQALVSTESGGEGRNLQFCNVMINYDLPWNPMLIEQRIGRIHRLGQKREVFVFNLAAQNTIESYILDLLANKIRMFELVVGELDLILGNLEGKDTFEGILRRVWLESKTDEDMKKRLDAFGKEIDQARDRFARIKEAEVIVSGMFE
ncbi:MAG: DEAD/DEAH box helicase [Armatimonadetes bacterium]|nr:DEAD/DEAH box helicase [Armatimonadota bacterium]